MFEETSQQSFKKNDLRVYDALFTILMSILSFLHVFYGMVSFSTWILFGGISLLCTVSNKRDKDKIEWCIVLWILYFLWILLGIIYSPDKLYAFGHVLKIFFLLISIFYSFNSNRINYIPLFFRLIIMFYIFAIVAQLFIPDTIDNIRNSIARSSDARFFDKIELAHLQRNTCTGIFVDPAVSAYFSALGIGIGLKFFFDKRKMVGIIWIAISSIALLLTNKRGPMLSTVGSFILILFFDCIFNKKNRKTFFLIMMCILFLAIEMIFGSLFSNWLSNLNANEYSIQNRRDIYDVLYKSFLNNPIIGTGTKSSQFLNYGTDGHNIYLASLNENGIVGFSLLIFTFFSSLLYSIKTLRCSFVFEKRYYGTIILCIFSQLYFIFYGFTGNPMTTIYSLSIYFFSLGTVLRIKRKIQDVGEPASSVRDEPAI